MFNSAQMETLHVITSKNELTESLGETIKSLKPQLMDRSMLKPSDTQQNLHTRNDCISQLNIEEAIATTLRLSQNDHTGEIQDTHPAERVQSKDA